MQQKQTKNSRKINLGDCLSLLTDYHANGSYKLLKKNVKLLDKPDYAIMIRTTNFEKQNFKNDLKYVSKDAYEFLKKSKIKPNDILMNKIANAGSVYLMPDLGRPVSLAMNLFLLRTNRNLANQKYVYYYLKANEKYVKLFAIGTAAKTINKTSVRNLKIFLPDLKIQKKIASILSAYDKLIENNNRRIEILEEMAQTIYKEWFVRFRFPGHEKIKMVDSKLGKIPEGWKIKGILDSAYFHYIDKNVSKYEGKKEYFATANIKGINIVKKGEWFNFIDKPSRAQKIPELYSVWYAKMKDSYKVLGFAEVNKPVTDRCILSSGFDGFRTEKKYFPFVYFTIKSKDFYQKKNQYCTGAVQISLAKKGLKNIKIIIPSEEIILGFCSIALPIINQIFVLQIKNDFLSKTRDLLLPKLISGKIDVSDLDINIEDDIK